MADVKQAWLGSADAAAYTGTHVKTVLNAVEAGELLGYQRKVGGPWAFQAPDLDRWMKGQPALSA